MQIGEVQPVVWFAVAGANKCVARDMRYAILQEHDRETSTFGITVGGDDSTLPDSLSR